MDDMLQELQERLGYSFSDPSLLTRAMTHASASGRRKPSNERLEFLGDAVVGLVISEHLFRSMPRSPEGDMTRIKSAVVSRRTQARVGRALGLPQYLRVDPGLRQRKRYPASMAANAYEAVVGAILVDRGIEAAREFVLRTLAPEVVRARAGRHGRDYKSVLQQKTQAGAKGAPQYDTVQHEGPDHQRRFLVKVYIDGQECGAGWGSTKKAAEQNAARRALASRDGSLPSDASDPPPET